MLNLKNIKRSYIIIAAALVVVLIMGISIFSKFDSTQRKGVNFETQLNAQYKSNQNELSAFISGFYETMGIAEVKSTALNTVLTSAVTGRYDEGSSAKPSDGQVFSAITEAYPDINDSLAAYDKVIDYVTAGREAYKQDQDKLLDMLRVYDSWRESGLIDSQIVSMAGFPSNRLKANTATRIFEGRAALDQMYSIVLTSEAIEAYDTGVMDPLITPKG